MLLKAHIFKKRSRGEREEVEIRLFNMDGSEHEGGGGGGGGVSKALRVRSSAPGLVESEESPSYDIPFGNNFVAYKSGFEFESGDYEVPAGPGIYLFQIEDTWGNLDSGADTGEARSSIMYAYPDSEDPETTYYDDMLVTKFRAPYSSGGAYKVGVAIVTDPGGSFIWRVDQYSQELGMTYQGMLTILQIG